MQRVGQTWLTLVTWTCGSWSEGQHDVWTLYFGIMSQYNTTFDLKINVGHCDLYLLVQWFCLIAGRLFDIWTPYFGIMSQYDPMFDFKIFVGHCDLYFMVQWFCLIFDIWTSYFGIMSQYDPIFDLNIFVGHWPIFHAPVIMPPTSKKLMGHIGFGLSVRASVHQKPCMLGFWNFIYGFLVEKYLTHIFFSCPSYLPFWSYAPLNKIRMKSDACHILWTVHARVLKFPRGKIADPYFVFLSELPPFLELCPFEKIRMKSCPQDISKGIWARGLKRSADRDYE